MTRRQLEAVIDALAEVADSWNEGATDDDRVKPSDALCLSLKSDGSGIIGRLGYYGDMNPIHTFGCFDGLCRVLEDGEGVAFDEEEE